MLLISYHLHGADYHAQKRLQSSYGFDAGQNTVFQHLGNDVIIYVQGFNLIFYNYVRKQTVQTLNVGENVLRITHFEAYGPGANQLLICEERPEGAFVSLYTASAGATAGPSDASGANQGTSVPKYNLLHRLQVIAQISGEKKEMKSIVFARMISATKLIVITGAPDFAFLVYENDQKTASMPTYSLRVVQERVLDAQPDSLKLLQLGERDFLLVAGTTLKTIKLTASPKFLPPNNIGSLSQKYYYTDAFFINKHLRAKYPGIPTEGDQFVVLTTREGALVFMYRTHILKELRLGFIDQVTSVRFLSDSVLQPDAVPGRRVAASNPVSQEEQQQRNYQFFNGNYAAIADSGLNQELAAGYFIIAGRSALHFLALRASELFRFIAKHGYFPTSNWEKQLNCDNLIQHLMSYSVATAADILYNKINGQFSITQIELSKGQNSLVFHGVNEVFKLIGALKLNVIFKRLNELDRQLLFCKQNGQDFRRQVEQQLLSTDSEEIKRLIAQDQFTVLKGEIIDLNKQQTGFNGNFDQLNIGGVETTDWDANREIVVFFDLVSNAQVASVCTTPGSDRITLYSKERQVRQFKVPEFTLINQAKFPEVARFLVQHASKDYVLLIGPDFVDKYLMQNGNLVKQFRFRVNYCSQLIVSQSGDVFLAVSGQNLNIYDFYNHKLLYIATMPSKILGICRFYQDYNQIQTAGLYFVYTQDGQITLFDASSNQVVKQIQIGGGCYIKAATTISSQAAAYLCKSESGSASQRTLLLCVLSDNSFAAFDETLQNVTQSKFSQAFQSFRLSSGDDQPSPSNLLAQEQKCPALKLQHLATQSSNEVICAINDGSIEIQQLMLGHMTSIAVAQWFVAIGYSLGYIRVTDLLTGSNQLIAAQSSSILQLLPTQAGDGFVSSSESGAMLYYSLTPQALNGREIEQVYPVQVNSTVQVPISYYKSLLESLSGLKQQIHGVRFNTAQQKKFLQDQFQTDQEILSQRALETVSALQSHQAKLKTDHENSVILLKRQIANNEKLFEQSQKALNQQYAKRSIFMKDELEKLRIRKMEVENQLSVQKQLLIQENQKQLESLKAQKKAEIQQITEQLGALTAQNEADEGQILRFYNAAEDQNYKELRDAETEFMNMREQKEAEIEQSRNQLKQTKLQYDELEDQLTKQQQLNTVKQQEIRELSNEVGNIKKDIQLDKEEIQQHDITINQREHRIQELDQKIRELNKIQFILQFKIRELKRTIAPKEAQLADLRSKIEEMNKELLGYRLSLAALQNNRKDIGNKIRSLKVQIGDQDAERSTYQSKLSEARVHVNGIVNLIAKQEKEHEAELAAQAKFSSLPPLGGRRPISGNTKAEIQNAGQTNGKLVPASGFCDRNIQFRRLVGALRALQDCLVNKPNPVKQLRKKQDEAGDFAKLESNVVKLQQKVAKSRVQSKSSTGGVMAQNAALLQEINQLRRELHQAMVQANASCHIDNSLIKEYEQNAAKIQQLRNEIKARQRQAQTAGFLPELQ